MNYYAAKMFPQAAKEFEQAIALRPDLPGLRLQLGQIYVANSEWEKADEQFRAEAKLQPANPEGAYRLGDVLLREGKMKEAADELRRSDQLRPDMPETLYSLGKAEAVGDPAAAMNAFSRVIQLEKQTPLAAQAISHWLEFTADWARQKMPLTTWTNIAGFRLSHRVTE